MYFSSHWAVAVPYVGSIPSDSRLPTGVLGNPYNVLLVVNPEGLIRAGVVGHLAPY